MAIKGQGKHTKYDHHGLASRIGEGFDVQMPDTYVTPSHFTRMVVMEVISDPTVLIDDTDKEKYWSGVLNVSNMKYIHELPRNSVIAVEMGEESQPMFVFPFFPSHLALPCKPGEVIWTMVEDPEATRIDIAYWMCKVQQAHYVDDVNHTHQPRYHEISFKPGGDISKPEKDREPIYELRNGPVFITEKIRQTLFDKAYLVGKKFKEDIFESLILKSDAGMLCTWESVPRFKKRPGDIALEGSNNSLIVLGTNRRAGIAQGFKPMPGYEVHGKVPTGTDIIAGENAAGANPQQVSQLTGSRGTIDMVVGRGQTPNTGGKIVNTTSISFAKADQGSYVAGPVIKKEIGKTREQLSANEGDFDYVEDRSRILLAQRIQPDYEFGLSSYNQKIGIQDDPAGDAAVVIKTDKMRIIARSDVEIVVTGYDVTSSLDGTPMKTSKDKNAKDWASIVLKSNGDIVFTPSQTGYIKLGGEDASKAILCTDYDAKPENGVVKAVSPSGAVFLNLDGSSFGGGNSPGEGMVATKILVK